MNIHRIAAFSHNHMGGNPAGVVISNTMPSDKEMLKIAKEIGYSETAFLQKENNNKWKIRYFSPNLEVDFCGHATIASGAVIGARYGEGVYKLVLNHSEIEIYISKTVDKGYLVTFESPQTWSKPVSESQVNEVLSLFDLSHSELNPDFPVRYAFAGAKHMILVLQDRITLAQMKYLYEPTRELMLKDGLLTINLLWSESDSVFHSRNAFAIGGVYEDPATGAAAAAFAGYLRDINWQGNKQFKIIQGEDMRVKCLLMVEYKDEVGTGIKITGETSIIN